MGRIWPTERVVLGLRVCRCLHRELPEHCESILLVKRAEADVSEDVLARDFGRVRHLKVALKWRTVEQAVAERERERLSSVASLGTALTHLDLSGTEIAAEGARVLAGVLGECTALAHLNLSGNGIGTPEVERLAEVLGKCTELAHLDLSYNRIHSEDLNLLGKGIGLQAVERLVEVLGQCSALTHLDLRSNALGERSAGVLAGLLVQNTTLRHLDLNGNGFGAQAQFLLEEELGELGACAALVRLEFVNRDW